MVFTVLYSPKNGHCKLSIFVVIVHFTCLKWPHDGSNHQKDRNRRHQNDCTDAEFGIYYYFEVNNFMLFLSFF